MLPGAGESHLRLYNGYDCDLKVTAIQDDDEYKFTLAALSAYENKTIYVDRQRTLHYSILSDDNEGCPDLKPIKNKPFILQEKKANSHFVSDCEVEIFIDDSDKSSKGYPVVRYVIYVYVLSTNLIKRPAMLD